MNTRFIICTDSKWVAAEHRNAITHFLEGKGWQLWHWMEDVWLVASTDALPTADELKVELAGLLELKARWFLVIRIDGRVDHAIWGYKESFPWLTEYWKDQSTSEPRDASTRTSRADPTDVG